MQQRKEELPVALEMPGARFQVAEWGEVAVAFVRLSGGVDAAPLLEGLPGDTCHCPHWGYMLTGAMHVRYDDGREEVTRAGELFHWPGGHTVRVEEDTSFVEFSPKRELKEVYDHIRARVGASAA
jgi:hypothetical protein